MLLYFIGIEADGLRMFFFFVFVFGFEKLARWGLAKLKYMYQTFKAATAAKNKKKKKWQATGKHIVSCKLNLQHCKLIVLQFVAR